MFFIDARKLGALKEGSRKQKELRDDEIYRIASFIVLGLILLLASVGYTRYRGLIEKYL